jgi:hypothetical protein
MSDDLRYPTGRWRPPTGSSAEERKRWVDIIETTPAAVRGAVTNLTDVQLDTPYRPGGWTVRQLVHHIPDSHMNAYARTCLALTEADPTIRPYNEAAWAELPFARTGPIAVSLDLLEAVHGRWVPLLRGLTADDFQRSLHHPDMGAMRIESLASLYAWHGPHHVAHITGLRQRERW